MLNAEQESYTYQYKMIFSSGPKDALFNDFMIFECVYYMLLLNRVAQSATDFFSLSILFIICCYLDNCRIVANRYNSLFISTADAQHEQQLLLQIRLSILQFEN